MARSILNGAAVSSTLAVTGTAAAATPVTIKGAASQSADLQQWQDSSGSVFARIDAVGRLGLGASIFGSVDTGLAVVPRATSTMGIVVKGLASQAADLAQWQDSAATVLIRVDPVGRLGLGASIFGSVDTGLAVVTRSTSSIGIVVRGVASQAANLQEWQASGGTVLATLTANGDLAFASGKFVATTYHTAAGNTGPYLDMSGSVITALNRTTASNVPFVVKGMASQTGDLQQWQDVGGSPLVRISPVGNLNLNRVDTSYVNSNAPLGIQAIAAYPGVVVRGQASQVGNLQEWQASDGTVLARVVPNGGLLIGNTLAASPATVSFIHAGGAGVTTGVTWGGDAAGTNAWQLLKGTTDAHLRLTAQQAAGSFVVKGAASHSATLQEWQNSAGTTLAYVAADGSVAVAGRAFVQPAGTFDSFPAASTTAAYRARVLGDANPRVSIRTDGQITWGDGTAAVDTNLYRSFANVLKTDDHLVVAGSLSVNDGLSSQVTIGDLGAGTAGINFGSANDVNLYRAGADILQTDDTFHVATAGSDGVQLGAGSGGYFGFRIFANAGAASTIGLGIRGVASQTADLTQWQDSTQAVMVRVTAGGQLQFGSGASGDTNLYRSAADTLKTDDSFIVAGNLTVNGALSGSNFLIGGDNLLANSSFEHPTSFTAWSGPAAGSSKVSDADETGAANVFHGAHSRKLTVVDVTGITGGFHYGGIQHIVLGGLQYKGPLTASAWLKATSGATIGIRLVRIKDGTRQYSGGAHDDATTTITADGTWQRVTVALTATVETATTDWGWELRVGFEGTSGSLANTNTCYVDAVKLEMGGLTAYTPKADEILTADLAINSAAKLVWATDTNLYRAAANQLKTDDEFLLAGNRMYIIGNSFPGILFRNGSNADLGSVVIGQTIGELYIDYGVVGGTSAEVYFRSGTSYTTRLIIGNDGKLYPGPTPGDTNLYRATTDYLKTDDFFHAAQGVLSQAGTGERALQWTRNANDAYWGFEFPASAAATTLRYITGGVDVATFSTNGSTSWLWPMAVRAGAAGNVPLIVKGAASQTGNLQEWQSSAGAALSYVNASGQIIAANLQSNAYLTVAFQTAIGDGTNWEGTAWLRVGPTAAANKGIVVRGWASQSAALQEWQASGGTVLVQLSATGDLSFASGKVVATSYYTAPGNAGPYIEMTTTTVNVINRGGAALIPLAVSGMASQSGNLTEWRNSAATVLSKVDAAGMFYVGANAVLLANQLVGGGNLAANSSFEHSVDWYGWTPTGGGTGATVDATTAHTGTRSAKFVGSDVGGSTAYRGVLQAFTVPTGTYKISAYIKASGLTANNSGITIEAGVGSMTLTHARQNYSNATFDWTRIVATVVVTSATGTFQPVFCNQYGGTGLLGTMWFDDIQVQEGEVPTAYTPKVDEILVPLTLTAPAAASSVLILKGAASQTADLQQWQNSSAAALLAVNASGTLLFGSAQDTNLYRSAANRLATDDEFSVGGGTLLIPHASGAILIGGDTNLYRSGANTLITDDFFVGGARARVQTNSSVTALSSATGTLEIQNLNTTLNALNGIIFMNAGSFYTAGIYSLPQTDATLNKGGHLIFATKDSAGSVYLERLRLQADGDIQLSQDAGKLLFGSAGDTNLYRSAANTLKTDDLFVAGGTVYTQAVGLSETSSTDFYIEGSSSGQIYFRHSGGVAQWRITPGAPNKLELGDGSGTWDTNLYRSAANTLVTDDLFYAAGVQAFVATANGAYLGYTAAGTVGPGVSFGSTADTNLYRAAADTLKTDDALLVTGALSIDTNNTALQFKDSGGSLRRIGLLSPSNQIYYGDIDNAMTSNLLLLAGGTGKVFFLTNNSVKIVVQNDGKLAFGSAEDTNLYRNGADWLKTDDAFTAGGAMATSAYLQAEDNVIVANNNTGQLLFGSAHDTNLYRSAANVLKTDDLFDASVAGLRTKHEASATPTGGNSGELRAGSSKLWVQDAGTWREIPAGFASTVKWMTD